jgi:hypothetical protein
MPKLNEPVLKAVEDLTDPIPLRMLLTLQEGEMGKTALYDELSTYSNGNKQDALQILIQNKYVEGGAYRNDPLRLTAKGRTMTEMFFQIALMDMEG